MKNIVLLSDGTGNSAGKRNKTNVWRLYQALDLHDRNQIAMYDDGVGTEEFLLPRLLGGAFGWGLSRNVIELYKFLCRNYEKGDKIYLFGFSRGAFTVRILAGLIAKCGLRTGFTSERDLDEYVKQTYYVAYRKKYWDNQLLKPIDWLCHWRCRNREWCLKKYSESFPDIEFIGVWDTVSAYGLPVEEIRILWDKLIYPLRFKNRKLNKKVLKACHALSIDDERLTFHPELWDESKETDPDRIEQVWFPGAHSDIGGGYPRSELALVSLDWMMLQSLQLGLKFKHLIRHKCRTNCDWNGNQHDSRAGLRSYYRYKPRDIDRLHKFKVGKGKPQIHLSVFKRIESKVVPYAPINLPQNYQIISTRPVKNQTFETFPQANDRYKAMNCAHDIIYWRRWLYYLFVITTLIIAMNLLLVKVLRRFLSNTCDETVPACITLKVFLVDHIDKYVVDLFHNPINFILMALWFGILSIFKTCLSELTLYRASAAWFHVNKLNPPQSNCKNSITSKLRNLSGGIFGKMMWDIWWRVVFLAIIFMFLAMIYNYSGTPE